MSAATLSGASLTSAQQHFTETLKAVEDAVHYAFRKRLRRQEYEEAMAEATAAAWSAWHGLVRKGRDPLAVGVHGIASNAIRYIKNRRRIGNRSGGRGAMDIFHPRARKARGYRVISLDSGDESDPGPSAGGTWREWLACDHRVDPADEAAFRLDFEGWLAGLSPRDRRVAELLCQGHQGLEVARMVGISPARICQLRPILEADWRGFQGEAEKVSSRAAISTA
jgi:hypothetical protein